MCGNPLNKTFYWLAVTAEIEPGVNKVTRAADFYDSYILTQYSAIKLFMECNDTVISDVSIFLKIFSRHC
jgi:hypothetical protein